MNVARWPEQWSRSPYNVDLEWLETVFTKTTGNKGKKDRGVELLQAGKATEIQVSHTANKSCQKLLQPENSSSLPVRQTREGNGEMGNRQLEKHRCGRRWC